jgi:uncharacterized membrane protein
VRILPREVVEFVFVQGFARAQHHHLHVLLHQLVHDKGHNVKTLLVHQP